MQKITVTVMDTNGGTFTDGYEAEKLSWQHQDGVVDIWSEDQEGPFLNATYLANRVLKVQRLGENEY